MNSTHIPDAARHFDSLPAAARVDISTVKAVTGLSRASIYRYMATDQFPRPLKLGGHQNSCNRWSVGEIRQVLAGNWPAPSK